MGLEAVGIIATSLLISVDVTGLQLAIPLFVYGIGVGFATAQLTSIVLSDIPPHRSGLASGANSTMRQVGSALGIAILGTVLFSSLIAGRAEPGEASGCRPRRLEGRDGDGAVGRAGAAGVQGGPDAAVGEGFGRDRRRAPCWAGGLLRSTPAFLATPPQTVAPIEAASSMPRSRRLRAAGSCWSAWA